LSGFGDDEPIELTTDLLLRLVDVGVIATGFLAL
jgi:hypothetical protein